MIESFAYPVVTMIVEDDASPGRILLQKRTKEEPEPLRCLWELPQGRIRLGESLTDCAARELKEETGLIMNVSKNNIKRSKILRESLESIQTIAIVESGKHSYLAICVVCSAVGTLRSSIESTNPGWFAKDEVLEFIENDSVFPLNVPMLRFYYAVP